MELSDAMIVAAAGIGVVFFGLLVTNATIILIPQALKLKEIFTRSTDVIEESGKAENTEQVLNLSQADPDVVAVIAAVMEIERRLNFSRGSSSYTFKTRNAPRTGLVRS